MAEPLHFIMIGLGSFGTALARRLCKNGCRVTGMDSSAERVEGLKEELYEAVIGSAIDREAMTHLPIKTAQTVFISLGEDITLSLLATLHAKELGARNIIVKGVTTEHGKILKSLGAHRVVFPEIEIAEGLADRATWPNIIDFLPIDPDYSFIEIAVPDSFAGKTLQEINLRKQFDVWVVGLKDVLTGKLQMFPSGEFKLNSDQLLLIVGRWSELEGLQKLM